MNIVVCMDSFKGSLAANEAVNYVAKGLRAQGLNSELIEIPIADGGEGSADIVHAALGGERISCCVTGPLPMMKMDVTFIQLPDNSVLVELASVAGLTLLSKEQRQPMLTTTYGVGEVLKEVLKLKPPLIRLALGGSATNDGGMGAACALGYRFLDASGKELRGCGDSLKLITSIVEPENLHLVPFEILSDVNNPLCGERGAARVFGPQKGATPKEIQKLDAGLKNLAAVVRKQFSIDIETLPGAGAAGGFGGAATWFLKGKLVSGIETMINLLQIETSMHKADWLITGEGSFDAQSLNGKAFSGLQKMAKLNEVKVAVLCGQSDLENPPVAYIDSIMDYCGDTDFAMAQAGNLLRQLAVTFASQKLS